MTADFYKAQKPTESEIKWLRMNQEVSNSYVLETISVGFHCFNFNLNVVVTILKA